MADNINVTPGSGATVAADDVGGVLFQKIKLDAGGDGATVPLVAGQTTMSASIPVAIASNQTAIPVSDGGSTITVDGTIASTQSGTWNVNNITGTVTLPSGAASESTLSSLNGKVTACNTGAVVISSSVLPSGAATVPAP